MPRSSRRLLAGLLAAAIAVLGVALIVVGALQATVLAPEATVTGDLRASSRPVVSTAVGVIELDGPEFTAEATAPGRPVFLGIGRARDVEAYLAEVSRIEVSGHDGEGGLITSDVGTEAALPDPAGIDIWAVTARETGTAQLTWPETPGQWRLVVATDGKSPAPMPLQLSWSGRELRSAGPGWIAAGVVALVIGGAGIILALSSALPGSGWRTPSAKPLPPEPQPAVPAPALSPASPSVSQSQSQSPSPSPPSTPTRPPTGRRVRTGEIPVVSTADPERAPVRKRADSPRRRAMGQRR